jgi:hypothetical protein
MSVVLSPAPSRFVVIRAKLGWFHERIWPRLTVGPIGRRERAASVSDIWGPRVGAPIITLCSSLSSCNSTLFVFDSYLKFQTCFSSSSELQMSWFFPYKHFKALYQLNAFHLAFKVTLYITNENHLVVTFYFSQFFQSRNRNEICPDLFCNDLPCS